MTLIPVQVCIAQMQKYGYAAQAVLHSMFCMDAVERSPSSPGAWPLVTVALGYVMAMLDVTVVNAVGHPTRPPARVREIDPRGSHVGTSPRSRNGHANKAAYRSPCHGRNS
jgi:hypothetical protein